MRSNITRITAAALLTGILAVASSTTATAADSPGPKAATAQQVADFEARLAGSSAPALDVDAYEAASDEVKAQIVSVLLSDDPLAQPGVEVVESQTVQRTPKSRLSVGGGATINYATYNVTSTKRWDMYFVGVRLGYFRTEFRYVTGNNQVLAVNYCHGTFTGLSGWWAVNGATDTMFVSNGHGFCISDISAALVYKNSNITWNKQLGMETDGPGIVRAWLTNI